MVVASKHCSGVSCVIMVFVMFYCTSVTPDSSHGPLCATHVGSAVKNVSLLTNSPAAATLHRLIITTGNRTHLTARFGRVLASVQRLSKLCVMPTILRLRVVNCLRALGTATSSYSWPALSCTTNSLGPWRARQLCRRRALDKIGLSSQEADPTRPVKEDELVHHKQLSGNLVASFCTCRACLP